MRIFFVPEKLYNLIVLVSEFYKELFGCKTYKISLDAGCTCPNRDGTKGFGGCIFCSQSGSGDFAASKNKSISEQVEEAKKLVEKKIFGRSGNRVVKYIAYFQNFSSTYGDCQSLIRKYREALECTDIAGLAVATRPDCISDEILSELALISQKYFVQLELGLQSSNEVTGKLINRCYTDEDYCNAVKKIKKASPAIHIVTHLIFGLPGETEDDMLESVRFVAGNNNYNMTYSGWNRFYGIKITSLYVLKGTVLSGMYERGKVKTLSEDEYFNLLEKTLHLLDENCVIHRLTGDPPKNILIAPEWPKNKKRILSKINYILKK